MLMEPIFKSKAEIPGDLTQEALIDLLHEKAIDTYENKEKYVGKKKMRMLERIATLQSIDKHWKEHLYEMDQLKEGINLRAYGQKDPLLEYKSEGFRAFTEMLDNINQEVVELVFRAQLEQEPRFAATPRRKPREMREVHESSMGMGFSSTETEEQQTGRAGLPKKAKRVPIETEPKVGRNDPCPCGSGKKYKKCHGK